MKYFEKNEVDLARARALIPEEMWNKDDPAYGERALSERFYQRVASMNGDNDKIEKYSFFFAETTFARRKRISTKIARSNSIFPRRPLRRSFPRAQARVPLPKS